MKATVLATLTLIGMFVLSACVIPPATGSPVTSAPATSAPLTSTPGSDSPVEATPDTGDSTPVEQTPEGQPTPTVSWEPQPGDEDLVRNTAEISQSEILILESFPPQYMLHLAGEKGNPYPCTVLRVKVAPPDEQNRIQVEVYTLTNPAATCIQMLETFDINVPLGSYDQGQYTVWVNGEQIGQIDAP